MIRFSKKPPWHAFLPTIAIGLFFLFGGLYLYHLGSWYGLSSSPALKETLTKIKKQLPPYINVNDQKFQPLWEDFTVALSLYEKNYILTPNVEKIPTITLHVLQEYKEKAKITKPLSPEKGFAIMGAGLFSHADPHSTYFTPKTFKNLLIILRGKFSGIGIHIAPFKKERKGKKALFGWNVLKVLPQSPAQKADLRKGDRIIGLDGHNFASEDDLTAAQRKITKKRGQTFHLLLLRHKNPLHKTITTQQIKEKALSWLWIPEGPLYLRLTNFSETLVEELAHLKKDLEKISKKRFEKGIILDLRSNPGGTEQAAIDLLSTFYGPQKTVVVHHNLTEEKAFDPFKTRFPKLFPLHSPLIILVDELSASASELVSLSLKENRNALLMGGKTYGKGTRQNIFPLPHGGGLTLTTAFYTTPKGSTPQYHGLFPHYLFPQKETLKKGSISLTYAKSKTKKMP